MVLAKLLFVGTDGWDLAHARSVIDLPGVFERLEGNFEGAARLDGDGEEDLFRSYAATMKMRRRAYEMKVAAELKELHTEADVVGQPDTETSDFTWDENVFWKGALVDWGDFGHAGNAGTWI